MIISALTAQKIDQKVLIMKFIKFFLEAQTTCTWEVHVYV